MELEYTPLYQEVLGVIDQCPRQSQFYYKATFLLDHNDHIGSIYEPLSVDSVTVQRDYVANFCDEVTMTCKIPLGKYAYKIYPNRTWLRVSLSRVRLRVDSTIDDEFNEDTEIYNAVLIEDRKATTQLQGAETKSEEALDMVEIASIKFQLFDLSLMKIRTIQIGGVYRDMTTLQILRSCICKYTADLGIDSVDVKPSTNESKRNQVVLPPTTALVDLPGTLQSKYGVYSSGLGTYIQNKRWSVFPLYDTSRFKVEKTTLTIYVIPPNKFPELDRTYRQQQDSCVILATSKNDFRGDNDINYIISGNGSRYADEKKVMEDYFSVEDNKVTLKRNTNTSEYIASKRGDGLVQAQVLGQIFTSNPHKEFSELARKRGGILKVHWDNSYPPMLIPGMATRIVYFDKDELQEAYGTLIGGSHISFKVGDINTNKHVSTSMLYIFTNLLVQTQ